MSVQLDRYLAERAAGKAIQEACFFSGIDEGEAKLTEAAIKKGEIELPRACAPAPAREGDATKEREMARDSETTVQIGDGPKIPLDDFVAAADRGAGPSVAADQLRLFIERIERLEEERKGIADDISDVLKEAKADGFDKPTLKRILKLRKIEPHKLQEAEALLSTYMDALGMTPIEAAIALAA
jgi:uncharacterized protein (UPF0335 family)